MVFRLSTALSLRPGAKCRDELANTCISPTGLHDRCTSTASGYFLRYEMDLYSDTFGSPRTSTSATEARKAPAVAARRPAGSTVRSAVVPARSRAATSEAPQASTSTGSTRLAGGSRYIRGTMASPPALEPSMFQKYRRCTFPSWARKDMPMKAAPKKNGTPYTT